MPARRSVPVGGAGAGSELVITLRATPLRRFFVVFAAAAEDRLIGFQIQIDLFGTGGMTIENCGHFSGTTIGAERRFYLQNSGFSAHIQALNIVIIG